MRTGRPGIGILFFVAPIVAMAQWLHYPSPTTPRTKDGKADLKAPAPRGGDGHPNLEGIWVPESSPISELLEAIPDEEGRKTAPASGSEVPNKYFLNILADFKAGQAPLTPSAAMREPQISTSVVKKDDPGYHCLPWGMPMFDTYPAPRKFVQTPGLIMMLSEVDATYRQVFTDGRKFPEDPNPSWYGNSIGRWEGDTLVVETTGLNPRTWLDGSGHTHGDNLKVTERYHRVSFGHMEVQLTLDDPVTFLKPLTIKYNFELLPDTDLIEGICAENERDLVHTAAK